MTSSQVSYKIFSSYGSLHLPSCKGVHQFIPIFSAMVVHKKISISAFLLVFSCLISVTIILKRMTHLRAFGITIS
ncbi:unnamed protein product [Brugia timori]|uniref:Ovule protein n=1 Tax=Brugia timori TaxID=42155 RepID=A0A0R3QPB0_9BILA|nr:unnamed protein product [Brugia timori]